MAGIWIAYGLYLVLKAFDLLLSSLFFIMLGLPVLNKHVITQDAMNATACHLESIMASFVICLKTSKKNCSQGSRRAFRTFSTAWFS